MRPPARLRHPFRSAWLCAVLAYPAALACPAPAGAATLVIHVQTADGNALAGAVLTARPLDAPPRHAAPVRAVMDQVNRAFTPTEQEVDFARRVVAAFEKAEREGSSSIQLDGFFIDYPIVYKAQRTLDAVRATKEVS